MARSLPRNRGYSDACPGAAPSGTVSRGTLRRMVDAPEPSPVKTTGWTAPVLAAVASLVLAVALTWPAVLFPTERLIGHPGNDNWNHAWGYWWVGSELLEGRFPAHTDLLAWPDGGTLYFIDTVQAVLSWPVQLMLGPAAAYNLVVVVGFAVSAFGAWLLARRVSGDDRAAGVALVLYGAAPHLMGQAYNGISETVCAGWLPLTLWGLVRLIDRPVWTRALALGSFAALCALTSWYYGLMAAMGGVVLLVWQAAVQPYATRWKALVPMLGLAGAVAGVLVSPLLLAFRSSLDAADALVSRDPDFVRRSLMDHNITDLLAFFRPSTIPSPDLFALYGEQLVIIITLGWTGLLLAATAWVATRRGRELSPWAWMGFVFFLFSLGPYLNVGGEYVVLLGRKVPLPFLALFEALPLFDRISHPFRFVVGVSLSLAVTASVGIRHAWRRFPTTVQWGLAAVVGAVFVAEVAVASPASVPVPSASAKIPAVYSEMATDPLPGAVLDLPMTAPNLERAVYSWYQTAHGRPAPWGLNDPMPRSLLRNRLTATLIRMEATRARSVTPRLPSLDIVVGARQLVRDGYRYVVVHENLYPRAKREMVEAVLTGVYGEPQRYPEDALVVWTLQPLVAEADPAAEAPGAELR